VASSELEAWPLLGPGLWAIGMGAQESVMRAVVANLVPAIGGRPARSFPKTCGIAWFAGSALMGAVYGPSAILLVTFSVLILASASPCGLSRDPGTWRWPIKVPWTGIGLARLRWGTANLRLRRRTGICVAASSACTFSSTPAAAPFSASGSLRSQAVIGTNLARHPLPNLAAHGSPGLSAASECDRHPFELAETVPGPGSALSAESRRAVRRYLSLSGARMAVVHVSSGATAAI